MIDVVFGYAVFFGQLDSAKVTGTNVANGILCEFRCAGFLPLGSFVYLSAFGNHIPCVVANRTAPEVRRITTRRKIACVAN